MTVSINGTSGIVNDATDLNYTGTLTGGTGVVNLGSGQVYKDASGNVGVGTSSPTTKLDVNGNIAGGSINVFGTGTPANGINNVATNTLGLFTNSTERARIDSSGNLLVGTTSTGAYMDGRFNAQATSASPVICAKLDTASPNPAQMVYCAWAPFGSGNNTFMSFVTETSPVVRGTISYNRAGGLTAYNTTSDYRAKTVNGPVQNALAKVNLLMPLTGRMNDATEDIDFFVAHELQEVVPSAVTGEKDAVNEDGTPKYQMVDKSALIPLLTAAIQEQQTLITALTARITALEQA